MKKAIISTLALAGSLVVCTSIASAATYNWTNGAGGNDFNNFNNWSAVPTQFATHDFYVNLAGANKAVISGDLSGNPDDVRVGSIAGSPGELEITGGTNTFTNTFRVGVLTTTSTGTLTMSGGTLTSVLSYCTFGDGGGTAYVTMTGGTINSDRQTWGQTADSTATLDMSGGTINIDYGDLSPATTSGSIRMGFGNTNLNISGTAVINTHKLGILQGGSINMTGGLINITGPGTLGNGNPDPESTFDFTEADIAADLVMGQIVFDGGVFQVAGNYESLLDAAIAHGEILTNQAGWNLDAIYLSGSDLTVLVPEPASLALIALAVPFLVRRKK